MSIFDKMFGHDEKPKQPEPLVKQPESNPEAKPSAPTTGSGNARVTVKLRGIVFIGSKQEIHPHGVKAVDGIRVEGAAAAPLALARREWLPRPLVLIVTGRNVDDALYNRILTSDP